MELLISISIAVLILTVTLANFPSFGRVLAVEREAQLVALALRDAEARAIFTIESPVAASDFFSPYGVHFSLSNPQQYVIFSDAAVAGVPEFFDPGEQVETLLMSKRAKINQICRGLKTSSPSDDLCVNDLSITFRRPAPLIKVWGKSGALPPEDLGGGSDFSINIISDDGQFARCVVVWTTGAMSIESSSCM